MTHTLLGRKIEFFISKYIFFVDPVTQDMYIRNLKNFITRESNNTIGCIVKNVRQIRRDLDNCINKKEPVNSYEHGHFDIETGILGGYFWNDIELFDDTPFICLYSKENKDKYFLIQESPWFIRSKNKYGIRDIIGGLLLETDKEILRNKFYTTESFGTDLINIFQYVIDPKKYNKKLEKDLIEEEENKNNNIDLLVKEITEKCDQLKKVLLKIKNN